jgi:hypothetical protein
VRLRSIFLLVLAFAACEGPPAGSGEVVILVHGLGRSGASMLVLETRLRAEGFEVVNFEYPSTSEDFDLLVQRLASAVDVCCAVGPPHHFVTHSMGGVVVRGYLAQDSTPYAGRVVMLSPPNQGSELIDTFQDSRLLEAVLGPSGMRLGTDTAGVTSELGPVDFSLGIITGNKSLNPIGSWLIPGEDDGKVAVGRARIDGATDFLVIPATHTFIMNRPDVAKEVVHFIREGRFRR